MFLNFILNIAVHLCTIIDIAKYEWKNSTPPPYRIPSSPEHFKRDARACGFILFLIFYQASIKSNQALEVANSLAVFNFSRDKIFLSKSKVQKLGRSVGGGGGTKGYDFRFPFQFFQNFRFPPIVIMDFRFRVDPYLLSYKCWHF